MKKLLNRYMENCTDQIVALLERRQFLGGNRHAVFCVVIGYMCGCFLTADCIARHKARQSVFEIGTGNPGVANIAGSSNPDVFQCHLIFSLKKIEKSDKIQMKAGSFHTGRIRLLCGM